MNEFMVRVKIIFKSRLEVSAICKFFSKVNTSTILKFPSFEVFFTAFA